MKKTGAILLTLLLMAGCNTEKREVERVAFGYLDAMGNYRIDDAVEYASRETNEVTLAFFRKILPNTDTAYIHSNTPAEIIIKEVEILTDTTAIALFHKTTPITQQDDTIHLKKEEGRWVVNAVLVDIPPILLTSKGKSPRRVTPEIARKLKRVDPDSNRINERR